ncbi:hypothetical protein [Siminovitchia fortis]|nr:hypothetical protein [Siminovitchia fortis]
MPSAAIGLILAPMALAAGQHGDEGRLKQRRPVASPALGRPVRRSRC